MGGFFGCVRDRDVSRVLSTGGVETCRATVAPLAIAGRRDIELHEDGAAAIAIHGYVREGTRALDAAEVLARWRRRGPSTLEVFGGEFALAIATPDGTFVARDRVGTRPVYVATTPDNVVAFATSMRQLHAAGVPVEIDREAILRSLILGYVPAPRTALAGIQQVGPGEWWQLGPTRRIHRYYRAHETLALGRSLDAAARALDRSLDRAVRTAVPAEGRIGAFLSGGLDSSLVLARLHALGHAVTAYTLHFGDHVPSELRYAQAVARHLGVPHQVLELDAPSFADAIVPALGELEDLLTEPIAVPNYLLAREAARSVDVLFTGEGGDPVFGGPKNIGLALSRMYARNHAPSLHDAYCSAHHHLFDDLDRAIAPEYLRAFDFERLSNEVLAAHVPSDRQRGTFVGALMAANLSLKGGNNILVKVAKMVGAHDLALRSPLFAPEIIDLALTIPPWQKLYGTDEKLVMKRVAARVLPRSVVERPKRGMAVPLSQWFRGPLGVLARDVLTPRAIRTRGMFRWSYVSRLLAGDQMPTELARSRRAEKLWLVLVTELYLRTLEHRRPARVAA